MLRKHVYLKTSLGRTIMAAVAWLLACATTVAQKSAPAATGRQYYFLTYDGRDGLSHNTVNKIMQDRLGFLWFGTKDGLNRFDGTTFRVFNKENSRLGNNCVTDMLEDRDGNLWVCTDAGLYVYNPVTEAFRSVKEYAKWGQDVTHTVTHIREDARRDIWFSVDEEGLYRFDINSRRLTLPFKTTSKGHATANIADFNFAGGTCWLALYNDNLYRSADNFKTLTPYRDDSGRMTFHKSVVNQIALKNNAMYLCTSAGLFAMNPAGGTCRKLLDGYVRTVEFAGGELWAGTEKGLCIYTLATGEVNRITASDGNDPHALADNAIYAVCRDKDGNMWIGSYFGGVNYYPVQWSYFEKYYPHEGMNFMGRRVREFCKGNDGTLWIGTEDKGLFNFDPRTKRLTPFHDPRVYSNVHGLCLDGDFLWIGTFSGGLNRLDLRTRQVKNYRQGEAPNTPASNGIFSFCRTSTGQLWIGTISGLLLYNRKTDDFTRVPQLADKFIYNILEDSGGTLWFATYANGVYRHDPRTGKWRNYTNRAGDKTSLSYNKVISICQDNRGRLWFMTQGGGLCRYDKATDSFTRYDMSTGFPSNIVYKMVEDGAGQLWVSTNKGLVCFNPDSGYMKVYTTSDGLLTNQFNYQSGLRDDGSGMIYMGCINGFIGFNPATFNNNPASSPVYFTDLYIFNKHVPVGGKGSPLRRSLLYSDELTLTSGQNSIALKTANLSYRPSEKDNLQYKLEGFDREWHTVNSGGMIYYSNLPYRDYTLRIRGLNSEGKANGQERTLRLSVLPPFYLTAWAYALYLLLAVAVAGYVVYRLRIRILRKQRKAMHIFEQQKERELYNSKITFFTNITHEIRTPLTLIKGPLDNILSHAEDIPARITDDLKVIDINTGRLLTLVNQLLDFRKTERSGLRLNFVRTDVSRLLRKLCTPFTSALSSRSIGFEVDVPSGIEAAVDTEAFTKIVSNLLSNAMKHAATCVRLSAEVCGGLLRVTVENDGDVIPPSMRESIFEPFVQYKDSEQDAGFGTGLGLTLARSMAELHHGTLAMDDAEDRNRFILMVPLVQDTEISVVTEENENPQTADEAATLSGGTAEKKEYTLLVVEDNKEMRSFIVKTLAPQYTVLTAEDGLQATNVLNENVVNLIISDIMMPNMDGISLCNWVKNTLDYSHIPVILLTAKTAIQSKIEGSRSGADAYIEKPFSIEYLKAETANLLNTREKLRQLFTKSPFTQTNSVSVSKTDNEFLRSVHQAVMDNLSNADFSLDDLAALLNMSRSSLNRKFRGLLDITPNDYIRIERLKQAAVMLKDGENRITEVCYACGFNTPSYFTRCFQKQFGVLPKDFVGKTD